MPVLDGVTGTMELFSCVQGTLELSPQRALQTGVTSVRQDKMKKNLVAPMLRDWQGRWGTLGTPTIVGVYFTTANGDRTLVQDLTSSRPTQSELKRLLEIGVSDVLVDIGVPDRRFDFAVRELLNSFDTPGS